jgi:hypothetical protein
MDLQGPMLLLRYRSEQREPQCPRQVPSQRVHSVSEADAADFPPPKGVGSADVCSVWQLGCAPGKWEEEGGERGDGVVLRVSAGRDSSGKRRAIGVNAAHDVRPLEESTRCVGMQRRLEEVDEVGRSGQTGVLLQTISMQLTRNSRNTTPNGATQNVEPGSTTHIGQLEETSRRARPRVIPRIARPGVDDRGLGRRACEFSDPAKT